MALNPKLSEARANAACDSVVDQADDGYLRIYAGTQATDADTAVGAQTLLAELRFAATAFGAASGGVATAAAITADSSANATGTATWFRVLASDGSTVLWDGSAGTADADLILNSAAIQSGAEVSVDSLTFTIDKG